MTPVPPAMASDFLADVDKSCQVLRGLLAVQPDVLLKLPAREIQQTGATVLALVDELNAWFLEHMAVVPRAKNEAANNAQHSSEDPFITALGTLRNLAAAALADALTARVRGADVCMTAEEVSNHGDLLGLIAQAMATRAGELA